MAQVLIVDDERSIRVTLAQFLRSAGHAVQTAEDADEALAMMASQAFDVVVSDIILPRVTGVELLNRIKSQCPDTIVIMITGEPTLETAIEAVRAGAHDYLTKPVSKQVINHAVDKAANVHALLEEKRQLERANREYQEHLERMVEERSRELRESRDQLRALAAHLRAVREAEALRIARVIHDELGQMLTALHLDLHWTKQNLSLAHAQMLPSGIGERMAGALELVDNALRTVQRLSMDLRPSLLNDLGLAAALREEARRFRTRSGLECNVHMSSPEPAVSGDAATALFRICQECFTNVIRHAGAKKVDVRLGIDEDFVCLEVTDDGRGISDEELASQKSLGLLGMKERASELGGDITIARGPTGGTRIATRVPCRTGA